MKTYPEITDKLERHILANAKRTFRTIEKPDTYPASYYCFASFSDGIDLVTVDVNSWQIVEVNYEKFVKGKVKSFSIKLPVKEINSIHHE